MNVVDQKYVSLLVYKMDQFKKKGSNLYNFRCPYCGDSHKNKHKARGYLYEKKGSLFYHCHNCGEHKSFKYFLKENEPVLYHEYILEQLKKLDKAPTVIVEEKPTVVGDIFQGLPTIASLSEFHPAKAWCKNRQIPKLNNLFLVEKFTDFVNSCVPDKLSIPNAPRIVIPFYSRDGKVIGFQGRAIGDLEPRYISIHLDKDVPFIYNIDKVNYNIRYFVVEGPFDSMFLDNAIAIGSSALLSGVDKLGWPKENAVFIFDNERRNKDLLKLMNKVVVNDHKIVIWPENIEEKDINDMVLAGRDVVTLINRNTFQGLEARLKFDIWKRI